MRRATLLKTLAVVLTAFATAYGTPVGLYTFEGNTNDVSGNGNNATSSTAGYGAGFSGGQAADFTPSQLVLLPLDIRPGIAPRVTIGAWVDADVVGTRGTLLSTDDGGFDRGLNIDDRNVTGGASGSNNYGAFVGTGFLPGNVASPADGYVFVAAVYDQIAGAVRLHTDANTFSHTFTAPLSNSRADLGVGLRQASNTEPHDGRIDNVFVYNTALTAAELDAVRLGGAAAAQAAGVGPGQMWSVDFESQDTSGFSTTPPNSNPGIGTGDQWTALLVADVNVNPSPTTSNPSLLNMTDSTGAATNVDFRVTGDGSGGSGDVAGFNDASSSYDPVNGDYMLWNVPGLSIPDTVIEWELTELTAGAPYEFTAFGAIGPTRTFNMRVDTDGDGLLSDETAQLVPSRDSTGGVIGAGVSFTAVADGSGRIFGDSTAIGGNEANWGGFQLRLIPEPSSLLLAAMGLLGLLACGRRRAR